MHLNLNDPTIPIYQQIAQQLRTAIGDGTFVEGQQIPSTTEISQAYQINPATVLKGMNLLVENNLLEKRRGLGMFVQVGAQQKVLQAQKQEFLNHEVTQIVQEARQLNISQAELIQLIKDQYKDGGSSDD
ncbi:GntR family transcriptional regulator [Bombilactobacillus bombi]|uniref:GntR family transcriptional regulator n=1 Tax=Bombilactobacillus bombi TaxID=1303590 RepID=UPI0015E5CB52|nr:GntR family transcriptional regulator [Bombilactobacillus bombi]MBA1435186.1 GntR family transcriptional regulator [Bombilactobacillus bombi]